MNDETQYMRVIPRDLFNEAKLLKCLGQLVLFIHEGRTDPRLRFEHEEEERGFIIGLSAEYGALYCANLSFYVGDEPIELVANYNSKSPYPLVCCGNSEFVFNDDGTLSDEFRAYLDAQ